MRASSFLLMLLLISTVAAASADRPTFWLLLGPAPIAAAIATVAFVQPRRRSVRAQRWRTRQ